jgi:hypothetical protein
MTTRRMNTRRRRRRITEGGARVRRRITSYNLGSRGRVYNRSLMEPYNMTRYTHYVKAYTCIIYTVVGGSRRTDPADYVCAEAVLALLLLSCLLWLAPLCRVEPSSRATIPWAATTACPNPSSLGRGPQESEARLLPSCRACGRGLPMLHAPQGDAMEPSGGPLQRAVLSPQTKPPPCCELAGATPSSPSVHATLAL